MIERLRRDVARPTIPVAGNELPFLALSALAVVLAAQISEPGTLVDVGLLAAGGLALVGLAVFPRVPMEVPAAAVLLPVAVAIGHQGHVELGWFLVVLTTLYAAWHLGSTTRSVILVIASCAVILVLSLADPDRYSWPPWVAAEVFLWILGRTLQRQRCLIEELEAARNALAEQAVADERRRIARELHDLAGHTLAAVLLHVTGARHVLHRDLSEADRALADAELVGRASMDQIRATVAALRTTERGTDAALPEVEQLGSLVAEYRRAGLSIHARIAPEVGVVDQPVGVALHRIGREALANVARHAPANHVEVEVALDDASEHVHLRVRDHGSVARRPDPSSHHYGVVGMGERARSLGGTLVAGPTADGWRVDVVLPVTPLNRATTRR